MHTDHKADHQLLVEMNPAHLTIWMNVSTSKQCQRHKCTHESEWVKWPGIQEKPQSHFHFINSILFGSGLPEPAVLTRTKSKGVGERDLRLQEHYKLSEEHNAFELSEVQLLRSFLCARVYLKRELCIRRTTSEIITESSSDLTHHGIIISEIIRYKLFLFI